MPNQVVWQGLAELRAQLRQLPEDCTVEAARLVEGTANGAYVDIGGAYPRRTGNLRRGMRLQKTERNGMVVKAAVKNVAPHANLFEIGTQARHTKLGAYRGSMPPGHVFVPRIVRARRRLTAALKDMVTRRTGATVTGEP